MYCPKCSQPASYDARYCSRCGLPLTTISDIIDNGGFPLDHQATRRSLRRRGMRVGAKLMFMSAVLLPIFFGLSFPADSPAPLLVPLTIFFAGLAWFLYSRIFGEDDLYAEERKQRRRFDPRPDTPAFRPADGENLYINPAFIHLLEARLADLGGTPFIESPGDFGRLLAEETEKWGKVVKFARMKPE